MTQKGLIKLVRSIAYRRRLMEGLPKLEAKLVAFLKSEGLSQIVAGGYKVKLAGGDIRITEAEESDTDLNQLEFKFEEEFTPKRRDQYERQATGS